MAKRLKDKSNAPVPVADRWKPERAMGLARALMKAGYGTRKQTGMMINAGRVSVDGAVVNDPNTMLAAGSQIHLDGRPLARLMHSYYAFNKPVHVVCSPGEGSDRKLVSDYFPDEVPGLQTVGRLDSRTVGLLLISNDRPWNNLVTNSKLLDQEFRVQVEGELTELEIGVMTAGVHLPGMGLVRPRSVKVVETLNRRTVVNMVIRDGKIRQIRRMLNTLRHKVVFVRRIRIGDIRLGDLPPGGLRHLTEGEIHSIFETAKLVANPAGE